MNCKRTLWMTAVGAAAMSVPSWGQMRDNQEKTLACNEHQTNVRSMISYCEMREQVLPAGRGMMSIDPGHNGSVAVKGWSRDDVLIRARIDTAARTESEARSLVPQVRFSSGASQIHAEGPSGEKDRYWSVSYEIFAPHQTDIEVKAHNGSLHIEDLGGRITFTATNGSVKLARLAGEVHGQTTNGSLHVELAGDHWDGQGMDVKTVNGGVKMSLPSNYSAHLETSTVNGGMHIDFPVTVQGHMSKDMSFNIGNGGATIRVTTTNGGVNIQRS